MAPKIEAICNCFNVHCNFWHILFSSLLGHLQRSDRVKTRTHSLRASPPILNEIHECVRVCVDVGQSFFFLPPPSAKSVSCKLEYSQRLCITKKNASSHRGIRSDICISNVKIYNNLLLNGDVIAASVWAWADWVIKRIQSQQGILKGGIISISALCVYRPVSVPLEFVASSVELHSASGSTLSPSSAKIAKGIFLQTSTNLVCFALNCYVLQMVLLLSQLLMWVAVT